MVGDGMLMDLGSSSEPHSQAGNFNLILTYCISNRLEPAFV